MSLGSGNIGATNVLRNVGKISALIVLLSDGFKGAGPVLVCQYFQMSIGYQIAAALASITGHIFSLYLKFKGGKGVATGLGTVLALSPLAGLISLGLWLFTAFLSRYSSLAALVTFLLLPLVLLSINEPREKIIFAATAALMITLRHKDNIKRLLNGSESKIGKKGHVHS